MKPISIFIMVLMLVTLSFAEKLKQKTVNKCKKEDIPTVIHKIDNWAIIAENDTSINTAQSFSGKNLTFTLSAKPNHSANKIKINNVTGKITIHAEEKDQFDVKVIASNRCGKADTTFNIEIDAED